MKTKSSLQAGTMKKGIIFASGIGLAILAFVTLAPVYNPPSGGGTAPSDTAYDATTWDGVTTVAPTKNAVRDKIVAMDAATATAQSTANAASAAVAAIPAGPAVIFDRVNDDSSASTNGTEDTLRSVPIDGTVITATNQKLIQSETIKTVASVTAARRIKKYLGDASGTLIWDSGALTISAGTTIHLQTEIFRGNDDNTARCAVTASTTSASTIPYVTFTEVTTGLAFSDGTSLTTTGIASGTGAAIGDILIKTNTVSFVPAAP